MPVVTVKIDADRASKEFKEARSEIQRRTKLATVSAAERTILPRVRVMAPSVVTAAMVVKATTRGGYLTARTRKLGRIAGLLNFGGTVKAKIAPKDPQAGPKALSFTVGGQSIARASVGNPRKYSGKHFIERGIAMGLPRFEEELLVETKKAFD